MRAASEIGIDKSIFMFCGDWEKSMLLQISHLCFSKALYRKRLQHRISDLRCCYGKSIGGKKMSTLNSEHTSTEFVRAHLKSWP